VDVKYSDNFKKNFRKRIKPHLNLVRKFNERVNIFLKSPNSPILRDHTLKGKKTSVRAFSITGDIRVIYFIRGDVVVFIDIGSHNQVY